MKQHRTASKTIHAGSAAGTLFLLAVLTVTSSHALPQSGTVVAGSATISQPSSTSLNIVQSSGNAIINWQGYSIGAAESVTYVQPSSNSIVLNRVTGVDPTSIFGRLSGNGQVWVINPNGLLVGSGATVQTGGFLASTMNISNDSFMSGKYAFTNTPGSRASIVNDGAIQTADGGYVLLSAPSVINSGSIIANKGKVHLASGDVITFSIDNGSLINVAVSGDVAAEARGITNNGKITADGGQVVLTARVAGDALRNVVNNVGLIEAHSIIEKDGIIILDGGDHGITANSGTVDASGKNTGETGGSVTILGSKVGLFAGSLVDVSGDAGGGTALIGGNFHGAGPEKNAAMTYVEKDAVVKADALGSGNGGSVAVWSDDATRYFGTISAKGGVRGGDGGFVEISGKHSLTYAGLANLEASRGTTGMLLLDPDEITIVHGSIDTNITVTGAGPFADTSSSGSGSFLSDSTINSQLGTANVTVTTSTESITSNTDVVIDTNSKTLTLDSAKNITLGGTFNDAGSLGALNLNIGQAGTGGTMAFSSGAVIKTHTVSITGGSGSDTLTGQNAANTWNITAPNTVTLNGMNATGIESLVGGSASDTFSLGSGVSTFNGSISGGSGANSLAATNGVNTWQLSAANSGAMNSTTVFSGISNLAGGSGADTFTLGANVTSFNGSIAGGGGSDTLAVTDGTNGWKSTGLNAGILNTTTTFSTITNVKGGAGTDTLTGQNAANSWSITGANAVTLDGMKATGIDILAGGSGADTFTLGSGVSLFSGSIAGGSGVNSLVTTNGLNSWQITGANAGTVNATTNFSGIANLTGGTGSDIFTLGAGVLTFSGSIAGGGGVDTVAATDGVNAWSITGVNAATLNGMTATGIEALVGGSGIDEFTVGSGISTFNGSITGGGGTDTLAATNGTNDWLITSPSAGTLNGTTSFSGISLLVGSSGVDTLTGSNQTYTLDDSTANTGSNGPVTWISIESLTDTGAGVFKFGKAGSVTGNISANSGTLDYTGHTSAIKVNLAGSAGTTTGIGGTWDGITTVIGSANSNDTVTGFNQIYTLDNSIANMGSNDTVTWSSIENLTDTGTTGSFNMGTGGSVSGNIDGGTSGTLDYGSYGTSITLNLSGSGTTGIGGTWKGITNVAGNPNNIDTVIGANTTYSLTGVNAGNSGSVFWTWIEKITDTGNGTLSTTGSQRYTLTGSNAGFVMALLPDGFTGIGNLTDTGAASFRFGANGGVSGNISAVNGTLDYSAGIAGPVAVDLTAKTGTGIGMNWSGITTIIGSPASGTMSGTNATYNLTSANTGNSDGVSWTSFENLQDSGAGIFRFESNGSVTGNISALNGTLDYSAGITGPVAVNLTAKTGTGIGGIWDGITTIAGSSAPDTMGGIDATYHLTAADAGNSDGVSWTSFERIADTGLGTVMTTGGQAYELTGGNSGTVAALLPGGFSGIGSLADSGAGSFNFGANGSISGNISAQDGKLDYSEIAGPVSVDLAAQTATGIGGTWSGISAITGSAASDTLTSSGATYHLTAANTGNSGDVSWTSFENLYDTGAGNFGFAPGGSITGNITAVDGTLDYSARSEAVTINLLTQKGSGIEGVWNGITALIGSSASDTIASTGATYNLTDASAGNSGAVSWSSFEKIVDAGTGAITTGGGQTHTLSGTNSGNVATLLPDGFTGIGNLTDFDAGIFRFGANGSITGNITAVNGTLDYSAGIAGPVMLDLTAQTSTGIGGTWSGISMVTGSSHTSDTVTGISQSFTLTGSDAGSNGSVSWTSFENITGSGTNSYIGAGGSLSGSIIDTGSSTTLQGNIQTGGDQIYTGAVTLADATALTSTGSGAITFAGTLDSDATPRDLTIGTYGATTFGGLVGASPLNSLTINAGGTTSINGGSITTSGAAGQVFSNDVVLGADTTLSSGSGVIAFTGALDGSQALTLSAGTGDISLSGAVGAVTRLNGFTITSAENVAIATIAAASLTQAAGSGSTTLNGVVDTTGVTITTNGSITNNGAILTTGGGPVVLTADNYIRINNAISSSGPITLTAGRSITEGSNGYLTTAALLTTRSSSGQALDGNGNNTIANINAVNSDSGDITLTNNAAPLTITGLTQSGGNLAITNSGEVTSSAPLTVTGTATITASGQPITLTNANDFTGVVTVAGAATRITDVNNLSVALNTTGPTILLAGSNMTVSGISTDTVTATAPNQVTLANPAASLLTITGNTITGTMNNSSPLDLTTTTAQPCVSVALAGNQPFLNFVGDTTSNIRGLGTYNGTVVVGSELENYKATIGMRAATVASATNSATMEKMSKLSRFDDYFTIASRASIINDEEAVRSPELDPILIDR
ncbi:MAG: hypothetical protein A2076_11260 [Geobacteraceae bacterium GWC2_53_11]|nr:MAG: hypothetical protein A2076_11260 [Geobacteraceae bacterium GWC2_53_11]